MNNKRVDKKMKKKKKMKEAFFIVEKNGMFLLNV
jgi:hypothetical protein